MSFSIRATISARMRGTSRGALSAWGVASSEPSVNSSLWSASTMARRSFCAGSSSSSRAAPSALFSSSTSP